MSENRMEAPSLAPEALRAWLARGQAVAADPVAIMNIQGVLCVVKRRPLGLGLVLKYMGRYLRACLVACLCKLLLGEFPHPTVLLRNGLKYEAARLRCLREAGCRVPSVWWQQRDLIVMEYAGASVADRMRQAEPDALRALVAQVGAELGQFHRRGFWHGGAQIRNLTLRDGCIWRIDFEENVGNALSLPLAQAYDLYQTLASLNSMRRMPEAMLPELGTLLLHTYIATYDDPRVRANVQRIARLMRRMAHWLRPLSGRSPARDLRAFFRVSDTLQELLPS